MDGHLVAQLQTRRKWAATFQAERVTPQTVEIDRNHGSGLESTGDDLDAPLERLYVGSARQLAFGKDAGQHALFQLRTRVAECTQRFLRGTLWDWNRVEQAAERFEPFVLVQSLPHQEADEARCGAADQDRVGIGSVIGNDERGALLRDVVRTDDPDFEEQIG